MRNRVLWSAIWTAVTAGFAAWLYLSPTMDLITAGDYVILPALFWASMVFVVYYTVLAPWWKTIMGRIMVGLDFCLACATFGTVVQYEFGFVISERIDAWLVVGGFLFAAIIVISRIILLGWLHGWKPAIPWKHVHGRENRDTR